MDDFVIEFYGKAMLLPIQWHYSCTKKIQYISISPTKQLSKYSQLTGKQWLEIRKLKTISSQKEGSFVSQARKVV